VERPLVGLGDLLFAHTGGHPLYLLETLKLWRERAWLLPQLGPDGTWRLELAVELATVVGQERSQGELVPPSVRAIIQARLARLSQPARQLVMTSAVLLTRASARLLWQVAELEVQTGVEALEEAIGSGILREEEAGEAGAGQLSRYGFFHDLVRDVVYTELGAARRQVLHQRALARLQAEGARAAELAYHARAAGETEAAYGYSVQAGMEAAAVFAVTDAIGHYEQARALLKAHQGRQSRLAASEVERLYVHLGLAYAFQNARDKAQQAYEELLAYAQSHQLSGLASLTLNRLAILVAQQSHDKPQVSALLEQAWQVAETSHDQKALAETEWNLAQIAGIAWQDPTSAFPHGAQALSLARTGHDQELEARCLFTLAAIHLLRGDVEEAIHCAQASLALYARLHTELTASPELSLPYFQIGAPLTQPLTNRASEALCWANLAFAQVHAGQVHDSLRSGRRALALAQEIKNVWVQVISTNNLTQGLLDAGAYEEALGLAQQTVTLARTLPPMINFQRFLMALGRTYHAVQQWEEARSTLEEAEAMAERLDLGRLRVVTLSQLCMNCAVAGQWGQAHTYAVQAIAARESVERAIILLDFTPQYETEALLRGGDEQQAREALHQLGEGLGPSPRLRIPYLQAVAVLAAWEGHREQALGHLAEAARLAADLGLPAEQWQIQATLGRVYEAEGEFVQAHTAWAKAARIIEGLAVGIGDEALRARFLTGPQIQPVLQHVQGETAQGRQDHEEQREP
jgi:tetratricopeptide (TPR) repeat protein